MQTAIYDGHAHLGGGEERAIRRSRKITSMVCAGTPKEAENLLAEAEKDPFIVPAVGLHPWHSQEYRVEEMLPFMRRVPVIGEIGMDSVWCQVPMEIQRQAFKEQLQIAESLGKPVVLHTKGMERKIGEMIGKYKNRYLVHWYSSMEDLDAYLDADCYFTIGPDLAVNPAVQQVARRAPIDRLLVETDGFSAVRWALGEVDFQKIPDLLTENMEQAAKLRNLTLTRMASQMEMNFQRFIKNPLQ